MGIAKSNEKLAENFASSSKTAIFPHFEMVGSRKSLDSQNFREIFIFFRFF